jgi:glutamyl-tRNA reductase
MSFVTVGLSHKTANLDLREQITIEKDNLPGALASINDYLDQSVLVSTCNRLEVYTYTDQEDVASKTLNFFSDYFEIDKNVFADHLYSLEGRSSVNHLFKVVSGLDSMIVGEHQILGQVRDCYGIASEMESVKGPLMRLFHRAFRTGRMIRRETKLSNYGRSVSKTAVGLARDNINNLEDSTVMVVGAGDAGRLVVRALSYAGIKSILVANRTRERADELAETLGGTSIAFENINDALKDVDVVISSTGSPGFVFNKSEIQNTISQRNNKPLVIIDIAVPRDVDPRVNELPGVEVYSMDDLAEYSGLNDPLFDTEILKSQLMVDKETELFMSWWSSLDAAEVIGDLYQKADEIRFNELNKTINYLINSQSFDIDEYNVDELSDRLDSLTNAIVNKIFHSTANQLRLEQDPFRQDLIRKWFDLPKDSE